MAWHRIPVACVVSKKSVSNEFATSGKPFSWWHRCLAWFLLLTQLQLPQDSDFRLSIVACLICPVSWLCSAHLFCPSPVCSFLQHLNHPPPKWTSIYLLWTHCFKAVFSLWFLQGPLILSRAGTMWYLCTSPLPVAQMITHQIFSEPNTNLRIQSPLSGPRSRLLAED